MAFPAQQSLSIEIPKILCCFILILIHTDAIVIAVAEIVLGDGLILLGYQSEKTQPFILIIFSTPEPFR